MLRNIKKAFAIACVTVTVGVATLPSFASAQNTTQPNRTEKRKPRGEMQGGMKKLNLTEAQKTQMKAIRESSKTRMQNVFTPEQRAKLEQARQSGDRKGAWQSLNLTEAQKQQMKAIRQETQAQISNLLTPEQKQQMEQMKQQRQAQRGMRGGMMGGSN